MDYIDFVEARIAFRHEVVDPDWDDVSYDDLDDKCLETLENIRAEEVCS